MAGRDLWLAIVAVIVVLVCLTAALIVWRVAPTRRVNRRLATVLLAEGLVFVFGLLMQVPDDLGGIDNAAYFAFMIAIIALPWLYLRFLPWGLDSPWTALLRRPWADRALVVIPVVCVAGAALVAASSRFADTPDVPWTMLPMGIALFVVPVYAIVASFDAFRRAPRKTVARDRARAFLAAFVVRDVGFLLMVVGWFGMQLLFGNWEYNSARHIPHTPPPAWALAFSDASFWFFITGILAYVPLLAYGVLKTQLFDIDIKIQAGIKASILTAIFVVAFFTAEQIGQTLISEKAGPYVGFAGAGLLALTFAPLKRIADRVAKRAMPEVDGSAEYIARRKLAVYRAAVEGAFEDGEVTGKERTMLTRLAAELALHPDEMSAIEKDVIAARAPSRSTDWTEAPT